MSFVLWLFLDQLVCYWGQLVPLELTQEVPGSTRVWTIFHYFVFTLRSFWGWLGYYYGWLEFHYSWLETCWLEFGLFFTAFYLHPKIILGSTRLLLWSTQDHSGINATSRAECLFKGVDSVLQGPVFRRSLSTGGVGGVPWRSLSTKGAGGVPRRSVSL